MISKNADFGKVLQSVEVALAGLRGVVAGTVRKTASNAFVARFSLPSNPSSQIEVHVRAYNLYTARPSGRTS